MKLTTYSNVPGQTEPVVMLRHPMTGVSSMVPVSDQEKINGLVSAGYFDDNNYVNRQVHQHYAGDNLGAALTGIAYGFNPLVGFLVDKDTIKGYEEHNPTVFGASRIGGEILGLADPLGKVLKGAGMAGKAINMAINPLGAAAELGELARVKVLGRTALGGESLATEKAAGEAITSRAGKTEASAIMKSEAKDIAGREAGAPIQKRYLGLGAKGAIEMAGLGAAENLGDQFIVGGQSPFDTEALQHFGKSLAFDALVGASGGMLTGALGRYAEKWWEKTNPHREAYYKVSSRVDSINRKMNSVRMNQAYAAAYEPIYKVIEEHNAKAAEAMSGWQSAKKSIDLDWGVASREMQTELASKRERAIRDIWATQDERELALRSLKRYEESVGREWEAETAGFGDKLAKGPTEEWAKNYESFYNEAKSRLTPEQMKELQLITPPVPREPMFGTVPPVPTPQFGPPPELPYNLTRERFFGSPEYPAPPALGDVPRDQLEAALKSGFKGQEGRIRDILKGMTQKDIDATLNALQEKAMNGSLLGEYDAWRVAQSSRGATIAEIQKSLENRFKAYHNVRQATGYKPRSEIYGKNANLAANIAKQKVGYAAYVAGRGVGSWALRGAGVGGMYSIYSGHPVGILAGMFVGTAGKWVSNVAKRQIDRDFLKEILKKATWRDYYGLEVVPLRRFYERIGRTLTAPAAHHANSYMTPEETAYHIQDLAGEATGVSDISNRLHMMNQGAHPDIIPQVAAHAQAAHEFLLSKAPRITIDPITNKPQRINDEDNIRFNRYGRAVTMPATIGYDFFNNTLHPEAVEAGRALHPEFMDALANDVRGLYRMAADASPSFELPSEYRRTYELLTGEPLSGPHNSVKMLQQNFAIDTAQAQQRQNDAKALGGASAMFRSPMQQIALRKGIR